MKSERLHNTKQEFRTKPSTNQTFTDNVLGGYLLTGNTSSLHELSP